MTAKQEKPSPMTQTKVAIGTSFPGELTEEQAEALGIAEWRLSKEAAQRIEDIESNMRLASLQSGHILLS